VSDSKREAILNAALEVFSEKGYHPATIDEIAERAGVGKGTVYSYFRSKSELMEQLIEAATDASLQSAEQRLAGLDNALDGVDTVIHAASDPRRPQDEVCASRLQWFCLAGISGRPFGHLGVVWRSPMRA